MSLRARILAGERLAGCFLKTPSPQVTELLALSGLDFIVADREHAPIDLASLDGVALAGRAHGLPVLIRATHGHGAAIWPALDLGCTGVMVPHVRTAAEAEELAGAIKYARGRGFSPSGRAGGYSTLAAADYRARSDADSVFLAQIEDRSALGELDAIAAVPEVDCLFVGPADLALSLGCAPGDPALEAATEAVIAAARRAGKAAGIFVPQAAMIGPWAARGMTVFVAGSDQSMILAGGRALVAATRP